MWKKYLYKFHRILGATLSILFILWFLTGFVMIYHNFPKINNSEKYRGISTIQNDNIPQIDSLISKISQIEQIEYLSLKGQANGRFQLEYKADGNSFMLDHEGNEMNSQDFSEIRAYASKVNNAQIIRIDTVKSLDRWVTYDKHLKDFPLYKFYFLDENQSELYVSSQTGEGIQYSNSNGRFWAWLGAIPHWLYIANLRHYTGLWKDIVIILSGIGSLMCIAGIAIGVRSFYKRYRNKRKLRSPYRSIYKWHHILGFVFGIFMFTFAFSGMMSLQKVPQWIIKIHDPELEKKASSNTLCITPDEYPLDYHKILDKYNNKIQKLEWSSFGDLPIYKAVINDSLYFIDASSNQIRTLSLTEDNVRNKLSKVHHNNPFEIELIHEYDNYYIHKRKIYPLPVYKITLEDPDRSLYYINPKTGDTRYFNTNTKFRKWTYQALHSFSIKYLLDHPVLWNILMWTTMIGGTIVSITGGYLSLKFTKRKIFKLKNK